MTVSFVPDRHSDTLASTTLSQSISPKMTRLPITEIQGSFSNQKPSTTPTAVAEMMAITTFITTIRSLISYLRIHSPCKNNPPFCGKVACSSLKCQIHFVAQQLRSADNHQHPGRQTDYNTDHAQGDI